MKGFTLIEIIIVVSIMAFLSGIAIPRINSFNHSQVLEQTSLDFASAVEDARSRSLNSQTYSGSTVFWGIETASSAYYLRYCADSLPYNSALDNLTSNVKAYNLPSGVTLSPVGSEIVFARLSAGVLEGAATYTLTYGGATATVTVASNGTITVN